jgi:hypothetical protein
MPELQELDSDGRHGPGGDPVTATESAGSSRPPLAAPPRTTRTARDELRRQIAHLERELGELFAATFPRRGIEWKVGAAGGPRMLTIGDLERIRDRLAHRLAEARAEVARRVDAEEASRGLVERMIADPDEYRWVRVSHEDVGEPGCKHWHSRPRFGILGMLVGWWRVKLSSGCPLANGRGTAVTQT